MAFPRSTVRPKSAKLMGLKKLHPRKALLAKMTRITNGYSGFTSELKKRILERDGYRCRIIVDVKNQKRCGNPATEIHHIISVERGGKSSPMNLISICHRCHCRRPGHNHMR